MLTVDDGHRADALHDLDDAETVEWHTEDSCSTLASTPEVRCSPAGEAVLGSDVHPSEEHLHRHTEHRLDAVPVLTRPRSWPDSLHKATEALSNRAGSASLLQVWATAHADLLTVPLRWRLYGDTDGATQPVYATPWVPFSAPLSSLGRVGTAAHVPETHTANTSTTISSGGFDGLPIGQLTQPAGSAQLVLGRTLLTESWATGEAKTGSRGSVSGAAVSVEALADTAPSVSRAHCTVHLHYAFPKRQAHIPNATTAAPSSPLLPVCRSFDVFALSSATALRGVPLQTHCRYHFSADEAPCESDGVLTLKLGPRWEAQLALKGVPQSVVDSNDASRVETLPPQPLTFLSSPQTLEELAVHRPSTTRRSARDGPQPDVAASTASATSGALPLARANTTSFLAGASTAVLATLSDLSQPVPLSEEDKRTEASRETAEMAAGDASAAAATAHRSARASATAAAAAGGATSRATKVSRRRSATSVAGTAKASASRRRRRQEPSVDQDDEDSGGASGETFSPPSQQQQQPPGEATVLYTTGIRLSTKDEAALKELGAVVNPHLRFARHARVLVAQRPLIRSVKLLTVLPYLEEVVHQTWLDTVMHTRSLAIPTAGFVYGERKQPDSIESQNNFDLRATLAWPAADRQRLLAGLAFWVHRATSPQEPPMNDLKTVLTASGGVVTRRVREANVLVLPQHKPAAACWQSLVAEFGDAAAVARLKSTGVLLVIPDDVFRCVLQQRPLTTSSVVVPLTALTGGKKAQSRGSRTAAASQSKLAGTPRASTSQRSPRPSTHARR